MKIEVNKDVKFFSQIPNVDSILNLPYSYILDKKITGIGASHYYLTNSENTILISPRLTMIEGKLKNPLLGHIIPFKEIGRKKTNKKTINEFKGKVDQKLQDGNPIKIIITYDSFPLLKEILLVDYPNLLDSFRYVVDEMLCMIKDPAFKDNSIAELINALNNLLKVVFLSATIIPEQFRNRFKILKDLPVIELEVENVRLINFNKTTIYKYSNNPSSRFGKCHSFLDVIRVYKDHFDRYGYFKEKTIGNKTYYSKEIVIFISNVSEILHLIKELNKNGNELTPENTDIICSEDSKKKLETNGFTKATLKGEGELNKTYLFCTRCSYEGCDMYSDNATTIILSNNNVRATSIDIEIDLPLIVGRLRNINNVFRNDVELYSLVLTESSEDYQDIRQLRLENTDDLLKLYKEKLSKGQSVAKYKKMFESNNYDCNYCSIDRKGNLVMNQIRLICDDYADQELKKNYISLPFVRDEILETDLKKVSMADEDKTDFIIEFCKLGNFTDKMKMVCDVLDDNPSYIKTAEKLIKGDYLDYYLTLGSAKIKALKYREDNIKIFYKEAVLSDKVYLELRKNITIGEVNPNTHYKLILQNIYNKLGISTKPKATDLSRYYQIKLIANREGRRIKIISYK